MYFGIPYHGPGQLRAGTPTSLIHTGPILYLIQCCTRTIYSFNPGPGPINYLNQGSTLNLQDIFEQSHINRKEGQKQLGRNKYPKMERISK